MTKSQHEAGLPRSPRAFETDASWYQSYWHEMPEPGPADFSVHIVVWAAVLAVGILIGI
jgi:hypothetical protein